MQRRSVKEALRATFSGRRGLGYIPPALERLRGAFLCVSCPEPVPGARSTADYPQPVPDPLPVSDPLPVPDPVDVVRSAGRGEVWSHRLRAAQAYVGAQTLGAFSRTGGNATKTDIAMQHCCEFVGLRTGCGRYALPKSTAKAPKSMLCTFVFRVRKFVLVQES
jgi:hypothetical protein